MKSKKIIALISVLVSMFSFSGTNIAFGGGVLFADVNPINSNVKAITYLKDNKIVVGYGDSTFQPAKTINRAEFLKIVMKAAKYEGEGDNCYKDVKSQWFAPYVCAATKLGVVSGYSDGTFKPEKEINFSEASKIIANTFKLDLTVDKNDPWFGPYVKALAAKDAIPFNVEKFDHVLTRGDMSEIVWRIGNGITYKISNTYDNLKSGKAISDYGHNLVNFSSCDELQSYIKDNSNQYFGIMMEEKGGMVVDTVSTGKGAAEIAPSASAPSTSAPAQNYSSTNIQVQGVDEGDIVKNDGKYIYIAKGSNVKIVEAYPPSGLAEINTIKFADTSFYPSEMYVDGDKLIVVGNSYSFNFLNGSESASKAVMPADYDYYGTLSRVYIFDISDRSKEKLLREVSVDGSYVSSRRVGDSVYLVSNRNNYYFANQLKNGVSAAVLPLFADSKSGKVSDAVSCKDVKYLPGIIDSVNYTTVAGIPIGASGDISREVIIGSGENIYSSQNNLYVVDPKYRNYGQYFAPVSPEATFVHKFELAGAKVKYAGTGVVPGTILNQFSMDESGDYFRIATTSGNIWGDSGSSANNLYVLDKDLNVTGKIEGFAQKEKIYSVRYVGDRAYVVTFKKVDPLFVADLKDPKSPKILGQLKIQGVSDYLHPYDENHLIGFGFDTSDSSTGDFAWFSGIKIAMFDVTDVNSPKELHKITLGDRGTYSPVSWDHKAFLFDKEKGFMAFPASVYVLADDVKNGSSVDFTYGYPSEQGAYVYDVSIENGFKLRGSITHYNAGEFAANGYGKDIERILYVGNYFYTTSFSKVKANQMSDLKDVKEVNLSE
ncbi:beta-propeller domain-containing protein [Candidatus Peregrinibacteria bacterium]|nr:beta-propeller domain-containing protein [Candidatus Peregrinibacteria bacterium]